MKALILLIVGVSSFLAYSFFGCGFFVALAVTGLDLYFSNRLYDELKDDGMHYYADLFERIMLYQILSLAAYAVLYFGFSALIKAVG